MHAMNTDKDILQKRDEVRARMKTFRLIAIGVFIGAAVAVILLRR